MSEPSIQNAIPTDSTQAAVPIAPVSVAPATRAAAEAGSGSGSSLGSFTSLGDLQAKEPKLYRMIQEAIFMQVKRVQDRVNARIKKANREH